MRGSYHRDNHGIPRAGLFYQGAILHTPQKMWSTTRTGGTLWTPEQSSFGDSSILLLLAQYPRVLVRTVAARD